MPKTSKKQSTTKRTARPAPQGRQERPSTATATKKATRAKRAPQAARNADASQPTSPARETKRGAILLLLEREGGATLDELVAATSWQRHSVRGLLSTLGSKGGHKIATATVEGRGRTYSIATK